MRSVCSANGFPHDTSPHPSLKTPIQLAAVWAMEKPRALFKDPVSAMLSAPRPGWRSPPGSCEQPCTGHAAEQDKNPQPHPQANSLKEYIRPHSAARGTQESGFKNSLNWNVDMSKVSPGFTVNKLLLHSSLLTAWPETIPGSSSKPSLITSWYLASNWLRPRKARAALRAQAERNSQPFEGDIFLSFSLDPFAKFFTSSRGGEEHPPHHQRLCLCCGKQLLP